jgi:hypothetical protein
MAKEFTADYTGVPPQEGGGGGVVVPNGEYLAKVAKAEPFVSKNGNPSVKVDWMLKGGEFDGNLIRFQNVTFLPKEHKWAGLSLHVLKQLRQQFEGKFKVVPANWVGKYAYIQVGTEPDLNSVDRNKVTNVRAPSIDELRKLGDKGPFPAWMTGKAAPKQAQAEEPATEDGASGEDVPF